MRITVFCISILCLISSAIKAQEPDAPGYVILNYYSTEWYNSVWYVQHGDTMVKATFRTVGVESKTKNRIRKKKCDETYAKVVKVYPYAHLAGEVMAQYEERLKTVTSEKERKQLLDEAEEQMKAQFESELKKLTIKEGVILIKLVDRQTGDNSYHLVQELKGNFSAFMWQSLARLFGHNLKTEFDAEGEDVWIENDCQLIEDGTIPVELKNVDVFGSGK
jgi:hypothetical protein